MQDTDQRGTVKERIGFILLIILVIFIMAWSDFGKQPKVYDCRMAEISPDFPPEVREECRKLIREELQREKNERKNNYI